MALICYNQKFIPKFRTEVLKTTVKWCIKIYSTRPPTPSDPKGNSKFETLLVKIFRLKQKKKSRISCYYRKNHVFSLQRKQPHLPLDNILQSGNVKQMLVCRFRHIQAYFTYSSIFRNYSGILQAYSGIFRILCNPGIFGTWCIQNLGKFRTRGVLRTLVY